MRSGGGSLKHCGVSWKQRSGKGGSAYAVVGVRGCFYWDYIARYADILLII